jgi:hypothetical protein
MSNFRHVAWALSTFYLLFPSLSTPHVCPSPIRLLYPFLSATLERVAGFGPCAHVTHSAGVPEDDVRLTLLLANWIF